MDYQHAQIGLQLILSCALFFLTAAGLLVGYSKGAEQPRRPIQVVLVLAALFFLVNGFLSSKMTIEMDQTQLRHWQGPGFIGQSYALQDITEVSQVYSPWYECCGLRWRPNGDKIYKVSGFDAVRVQFQDGDAHILGTNDAANLVDKLSNKLAAKPPAPAPQG